MSLGLKDLFGSAFITFEGGEGAGKTTQIVRLSERLRTAGLDVVATREPGGTAGAEAIRELILNHANLSFSSLTETLLFFAARRDHVEKVIRPALEQGAVVLCDRFTDSTRAYQGAVGEVSTKTIDLMAELVLGDLKPDATIILDIDPEEGLRRAMVRREIQAPDRFEAQSLEFHKKIRAGFLEIGKREPERCCVVQTLFKDSGTIEQEIYPSLQELLAKRSHTRG